MRDKKTSEISLSLVRGNCSPTHSHTLARRREGKRKRLRPKMQLWQRKVLSSSLWRDVNRGVNLCRSGEIGKGW